MSDSRIQRSITWALIALTAANIAIAAVFLIDPSRFTFYLLPISTGTIIAELVLIIIALIMWTPRIAQQYAQWKEGGPAWIRGVHHIMAAAVIILPIFYLALSWGVELLPTIGYPEVGEWIESLATQLEAYRRWVYVVLILSALSLFFWHAEAISTFWEKDRGGHLGNHSNRSLKNWQIQALVLFIAAGAAFLLRVIDLDQLEPYTDEYSHLMGAKELIQGVPIAEVYGRSIGVVTLPVAASLWLFDISLYAARLPGVIAAALAVIPLYAVLKRISIPVAVTGLVLYITNPWLIAIARNVREYAFYSLIFLTCIWLLLKILDELPQQIRLKTDIIASLKNPRLLTWIGLALIPAFYFLVDNLSTGRIIFLAYIATVAIAFFRLDFQDRFNRRVLAVVVPIAAIWLVLFIRRQTFVDFTPEFTPYWLNLTLFRARQQWFYELPKLIPLIALSLTIVLYGMRRNATMLYLLATSGLIFYFFSFHFSRYLRPRYGSSIELFYIAVLSIGIVAFISLIHAIVQERRWLSMPIATIALVGSMNIPHIMNTVTYAEHDRYAPITGEYHDKLSGVYTLIESKRQPDDVLIGTVFRDYHSFLSEESFPFMHQYNSKEPLRVPDAYAVVEEYDSGFIVIDERRVKNGIPRRTHQVGDTQLNYLGRIDAQYVWEWRK